MARSAISVNVGKASGKWKVGIDESRSFCAKEICRVSILPSCQSSGFTLSPAYDDDTLQKGYSESEF